MLMKNIIALTFLSLTSQVFANPYEQLDNTLEKVLKTERRLGISSTGKKCEVNKNGAMVMVIDLSKGCIGENNTIGIDCLSQFLYNQSSENMSIKELKFSERLIIAEIKSKDTEEYASAITGKIEIEIGKNTLVRVSSKKKLFGGYKRVLDCII